MIRMSAMKSSTSPFPLPSKVCFLLVLLMLVFGAGQEGAASSILSSFDASAPRSWNREDRHGALLQIVQTRQSLPRLCVKQGGGQGAALPPRVAPLFPPVPRDILSLSLDEHHLPRLSDFRGMLPLPCAPPSLASL